MSRSLLALEGRWGGEHFGEKEQFARHRSEKSRTCSKSIKKGCRYSCMTVQGERREEGQEMKQDYENLEY